MQSKSILFVDDDTQLMEALGHRCQQIGFEVVTAHNMLTALSLLGTQRPDVVCVDVAMPTGNGLNLCETISGDPDWCSIPVIVLTGKKDEATIKRCQELSAKYVCKGADAWTQIEIALNDVFGNETAESSCDSTPTVREETPVAVPSKLQLIDAVFEMLGAGYEPIEGSQTATDVCETQDWVETPPWVLCVEDDHDFSLALKLKLEQRGISVLRAFEGLEGVKQAFTKPADAIILDFNLPNGQGDFVLRRLKTNPLTKHIPVIVLTGVKDQTLEQRMLSLGAAKFLTKPLDFDALEAELKRHIQVDGVSL